MTTIVDPDGVSTPVYNKSGAVVIEVELEVGSGALVFRTPHHATKTIVVVTSVTAVGGGSPIDEGGITLPAGADIGDVVDLFGLSNPYPIHAPPGEDLGAVGFVTEPNANTRRYTKVASTRWCRDT